MAPAPAHRSTGRVELASIYMYLNETFEERIRRFTAMGIFTTRPVEDGNDDAWTAAKRAYDERSIQVDRVTGRARPYWHMVVMPFSIFDVSRREYMNVQDDEVYAEYVKVVCCMMDAGVSVFGETARSAVWGG